jgi:hypothetical protein
MKTELLGGKIRGKIEFLEGEKETQGVGREIFSNDCMCTSLLKWALESSGPILSLLLTNLMIVKEIKVDWL